MHLYFPRLRYIKRTHTHTHTHTLEVLVIEQDKIGYFDTGKSFLTHV